MISNSLIIYLWFLICSCTFDVVVVIEASKASFVETFVSIGMHQSDLIDILNYLMCMRKYQCFLCAIACDIEIMLDNMPDL